MMSLAHFRGCRQVSDNYAIDVASCIAEQDGDEMSLTLCDAYGITDSQQIKRRIINKLEEHYEI